MMWKSIPCFISELNLDITLACGQAFRWKKTKDNGWIGVLENQLWSLKQSEENLLYTVHDADMSPIDELKYNKILHNYFQLDVNLNEKYKEWCAADINFKKVAKSFNGIRMLRQDPVETLFCFICSSNNNIKRITNMIEKLCENYGEIIGEVDGEKYYSFPKVSSLAKPGVEERLRKLNFGYRAKYIAQTAKFIESQEDKEDWLYKLRKRSYEVAFQELQKLSGVGAKVADCICLMALDKPEALPVDTHVYQIARQNYMPHLKQKKSLTPVVYKEIGDCFRKIFGFYAGWAHSVLFSAELKKFSNIKNEELDE